MIEIYHKNDSDKKAWEKQESLHKNSLQGRSQKENYDWGNAHG